MSKLIQIHQDDNVAVTAQDIKKGETVRGITALQDIPKAHKMLLCDLKKGDAVIKYGYPIGHMTADAKRGSYVHEHNLATNLSSGFEEVFTGTRDYHPRTSELSVNAYRRSDGSVGIRNEIWIVPTVGCVNQTALALEKIGNDIIGDGCDGVFAYCHPYGCSQMDEDLDTTRKMLVSLVKHPNAGGVLVLSLGCENNNLKSFLPALGDYDSSRVKFLVTQEAEDELAEGKQLLAALYDTIKNDTREEVNINRLVIGCKCGGSDAFSGITANALCGKVTEKLTSIGASAILTEVPEMFGAEQILTQRCVSKSVFDKTVRMIRDFKQYFASHGKECYENPSPGNHDGGITTLEEKSLGCVQKGGKAVITDVLGYGESCTESGLNLLTGPGNDMVSVTNLTAAGAHMILFTTGRGTPLGAPVPTVKISSNTALFEKKKNWIDFNAGALLETADFDGESARLLSFIIDTANGAKTKNEQNGYRDIAIFKDGVTM